MCSRSVGEAAAGPGERRERGTGRGARRSARHPAVPSTGRDWEFHPEGPSTVRCSRRAPQLAFATFFSTSPLSLVRGGGRGVGDATFPVPVRAGRAAHPGGPARCVWTLHVRIAVTLWAEVTVTATSREKYRTMMSFFKAWLSKKIQI